MIGQLCTPHFICLNPLSANFRKWSNTLKQFVGIFPTNSLSVFDYFVGLALKGLRLASDRVVLYENGAFAVLALSTKNGIPVFWSFSFFGKFVVKVLKTFKISTDCHIKTCRFLKRRAINPQFPFLEEPLALKWNL